VPAPGRLSAPGIKRIGLKQIEYFRAIMETGTVSAAAGLLNVSQPNVSRMLKYTESRLSFSLFVRRKGRLVPTPEAQALFWEVQSLHRHLESLQEAVERIALGHTGRFCVGVSPSLGRYVVPSLISRLCRDLPALAVKLDILSVSQVIDYLAFGQGECACTIFPVKHPQIQSEVFATGALLCAVPQGHPLEQSGPLSAQDLAGEALIGFDNHTPHGQVVAEFFEQSGLTPVITTTVRFAETACALAEQGNGIALVDEFTLAGNAFPQLKGVKINFRKAFRIHFHRASRRPLSAVATRFRQMLSQWAP
jgi:DNA-binding transcriptional LysR family regulator